ncbi:MAG: glycosyltransferase [Candidatus Diapherotrites archaeon]|nr:glycosyltransferase [Candidatus Diapherotrites archaeon]
MAQDIIVFEASWEVVNKVGGIHTVLSSKAPIMKKNFKDYFAVGPYIKRTAATDFENEKPSPEFQAVFDRLEKEYGIKCYSGHWLVTGRPKCLLVDPGDLKHRANDIKREYWDFFRIDSLNSGADFDEPLVWGKAAGMLLEELINNVFAKEFKKEGCVVHCHEWLAGGILLHLKHFDPEIKTVFTTHATILGRSIAEAGQDLHREISEGIATNRAVDDGRCYQFNVQAKHLTEKACAHNANVFTTVSEITGREAQYLLGKKPHAILPNGLNLDKFYVMEELSNLHVQYRSQIRKFVMDYFAPYYQLNVEETIFYFISGRYEFRNKGLDLFIDALGELNKKLKESNSKKTVVAFIWVPSDNRGKNIELLKHMALYERLEDEIEEEVKKIKNRLYYNISKGQPPTSENLLDEEFLYNTKKMLFELKHGKNDLPPVCALEIGEENSITRTVQKNKLFNKESDKVKIIYYPTYLSQTDGLIGLDYYQAAIGCHLGAFPSYYEPWGYTPLETMALALPTITSDLSGFGQYLEKNVLGGKEEKSVKVVKRMNTDYETAKKELADYMLEIYSMDKRERVDAKISAKKISYLFDWTKLIEEYEKAYCLLSK